MYFKTLVKSEEDVCSRPKAKGRETKQKCTNAVDWKMVYFTKFYFLKFSSFVSK